MILQFLVSDIERFDTNSNVLSVLFNLIEVISTQHVEPQLTVLLYSEFKLLQVLTARLSLTEYRKRPNERKDIYAYIHALVKTIIGVISMREDSPAQRTLKTIVDANRTFWNALEAATH